MTIWTPDLTPFEGPLYLKLVKAIEQAISDAIISEDEIADPRATSCFKSAARCARAMNGFASG